MSNKTLTTLEIITSIALAVVVVVMGIVMWNLAQKPATPPTGGVGSALNTYSGPTTTLVPVGVTSTQVLAINGQRVFAYIQEIATGTVPVWCIQGGAAQISSGKVINPMGSSTLVSYTIDANADYLGVLNCIASATTTVSVTEK